MRNDDERDSMEERANLADMTAEQEAEWEAVSADYVDTMAAAYVQCALWAGMDWSNVVDHGGTDDNPTPWDENYTADDLADETADAIRELCTDFYRANHGHLTAGDWDAEQAGHDLYLTRNEHGAGYWDRGKDRGEELSDAARVLGESDFYRGDDGKLYLDS